MQFLYYPDTSREIILEGEEFKYLFKVRRFNKETPIKIRNLKDDYLYIYEVTDLGKKRANLKLKEKILKPNKPEKFTHIAWCIIEPKNIEKTLPSLNEMGLSKLTLVYCDFSQRNFKLKPERLSKILINSSQQCGRSDILEIEILNSSKEFFEKYPNFSALDFGGEIFDCKKTYQMPILIGPEGGFSEKEKNFFKKIITFGGFVLRSETAACALTAKVIL